MGEKDIRERRWISRDAGDRHTGSGWIGGAGIQEWIGRDPRDMGWMGRDMGDRDVGDGMDGEGHGGTEGQGRGPGTAAAGGGSGTATGMGDGPPPAAISKPVVRRPWCRIRPRCKICPLPCGTWPLCRIRPLRAGHGCGQDLALDRTWFPWTGYDPLNVGHGPCAGYGPRCRTGPRASIPTTAPEAAPNRNGHSRCFLHRGAGRGLPRCPPTLPTCGGATGALGSRPRRTPDTGLSVRPCHGSAHPRFPVPGDRSCPAPAPVPSSPSREQQQCQTAPGTLAVPSPAAHLLQAPLHARPERAPMHACREHQTLLHTCQELQAPLHARQEPQAPLHARRELQALLHAHQEPQALSHTRHKRQAPLHARCELQLPGPPAPDLEVKVAAGRIAAAGRITTGAPACPTCPSALPLTRAAH